MEDLPSGYRPNVGVCLINSDNQVFVASRLNVPGAWQMPQGGIEDGEDPKTAAIRELQEETGIVSAEIIAEVPHWLTYDFPPAVKAKVNRLWGGEWHGQAQKWFLARLTNDDSEINLGNGEADPEFAEWKWASPEEVIDQAVDYKRLTYEEVMRTFSPYFRDDGKAAKCELEANLVRENRGVWPRDMLNHNWNKLCVHRRMRVVSRIREKPTGNYWEKNSNTREEE